MRRITKDERVHCVKFNECLDCHAKGEDTKAIGPPQQRRKLKVPCCRKHFNEYRSKMSQLNQRKYQRRSQTKQKLGRCVHSGCRNKLIPRELLPRRMRERCCGLHGTFKAFRVNRIAMSKFITDHCLTAEQRKDMRLRNVIYKRPEGLVFIGMQYPGYYQTQIWSASDLRRRYDEIHPK